MSGYECHRHPSQLSDDVCGSCGRLYCEPCLVYLGGDHHLPHCHPCALVAAGVRPASSVRRVRSRRELSRLRRDRRREGRPQRHPRRVDALLPPLVSAATPITPVTGEADPFAWADALDR